MRKRWRQAGEGQLGCIVWAVIVGIVALIAWKAIPVKIASAELYDFVDDQARYTKKGSEEKAHKVILNKARELGLPLLDDDLLVERRGDNVFISYYYTVDLEFPGYTYSWEFSDEFDRQVFVY